MLNTLADNVDTMVDYQPIVLPVHGQVIRKHIPYPQPPAPAPRAENPERRPRPCTAETPPLIGLGDLGLVTPEKPCLAVTCLHKAEAAGNTSDVDVDQ
jgi:hypothetical protein